MALRIVFVGASTITVLTARKLLEAGHEVVVVDGDGKRIDALQEDLDCGFVQGDGTQPKVLEDVGLESADHVFCLSGSDQDNILASLVARSMKVKRVVTKIENPDYELLCTQLGLQDTIIPDREVAESLAVMVAGREPPMAAALEGNLRFFTFVADATHEGHIEELELPKGCRVVALTRAGESLLPDGESEVREDDRVLVIAEEDHLADLEARFRPRGGP